MAERTDMERMDWLHEKMSEITAMTDVLGKTAWWSIEYWSEATGAYLDSQHESPDLRAAIDAAIDAEEKSDE